MNDTLAIISIDRLNHAVSNAVNLVKTTSQCTSAPPTMAVPVRLSTPVTTTVLPSPTMTSITPSSLTSQGISSSMKSSDPISMLTSTTNGSGPLPVMGIPANSLPRGSVPMVLTVNGAQSPVLTINGRQEHNLMPGPITLPVRQYLQSDSTIHVQPPLQSLINLPPPSATSMTQLPGVSKATTMVHNTTKPVAIQTIQLPVVHTVAPGAQVLHNIMGTSSLPLTSTAVTIVTTPLQATQPVNGESSGTALPMVSTNSLSTNCVATALSSIAAPPDLLAAATQATVPHLATQQMVPQSFPRVSIAPSNTSTYVSIAPAKALNAQVSQPSLIMQAVPIVSTSTAVSQGRTQYSQLLPKGSTLTAGTVVQSQNLPSTSSVAALPRSGTLTNCTTPVALPGRQNSFLSMQNMVTAVSTNGSTGPSVTPSLTEKENRSFPITTPITAINLLINQDSARCMPNQALSGDSEVTGQGTASTARPSTTSPATNSSGKISVLISGHFCVECNRTCAEPCTAHPSGHLEIKDAPILPRARVTLPQQFALHQEQTNTCVVTRELIPKWTRLGPVVGNSRFQSENEVVVETAHTWRIFKSNGDYDLLDCADEESANWMRFLRRARVTAEQNLVAYQQDSQIYMMTCCDVAPNTVLLYWYSNDYATLIGQPPRPEDWFSCGVCGEQFDDLRGVKQHIKYIHPDMSTRKWKCTTCSRAFTSAVKLKTHMMCHAGVRPHRCQHCGKTFTDQSNLRMHLSIHTGERKFKCTLCSRAFRQKAHLASHLLTHTGEKKMKCRYCSKMFARKSDVKAHEYQHTKEPMFACHVGGCSKAFYKIPNLKKHLKVHNGVRDFACDGCKRPFVTKYHLQRHLKACRGNPTDPAVRGDRASGTLITTDPTVTDGSQTIGGLTSEPNASTNAHNFTSQVTAVSEHENVFPPGGATSVSTG